MMTDQLETTVQSLPPIHQQLVERYTRLCRAYVQLSDRFHQLDVNHMTLKGQVVPLLKALKIQQDRLRQMQTDKETLQETLAQRVTQHRQDLQALTRTYEERLASLSHHIEELQSLEGLLSSAACHDLAIAEEQMDLVEATLHEMAEDDDPDLSADEKALLAAYRANPEAFLVALEEGA
ncbi:MAG: penicillin acylase family protein [Leptolyngbya sp.]|nr:penicillin acylase family protein [Leptolyngbya sp.]